MADPPKLLDQVRNAIRARHYSRRTEEAYVHWIRKYILFHGKRHPRELGAAHVTAFLTALAIRDRVSALSVRPSGGAWGHCPAAAGAHATSHSRGVVADGCQAGA